MPKHFIIGLGWLGLPLAQHLLTAGGEVAGTTRSEEKCHTLLQLGIDSHLFDLYTSDIEAIPKQLFENANVVINIPPGRQNFEATLFIKRMQQLFKQAAQSGARHICFVSTTSVFGGLSGRVSNASLMQPSSASGEAHVALETYLKELTKSLVGNQTRVSASVLRLAGLVGANRHPIKTLSQKSNISLGNNPVNLIHQKDVILVISQILASAASNTQPLDNGNFFAGNLCASEHPSRAEYYTWCAKQLGLRIPDFEADDRKIIDGKWIDAKATLRALNIELEYPSPYQMLK